MALKSIAQSQASVAKQPTMFVFREVPVTKGIEVWGYSHCDAFEVVPPDPDQSVQVLEFSMLNSKLLRALSLFMSAVSAAEFQLLKYPTGWVPPTARQRKR